MRADHGIVADFDLLADDRKGTDGNVGSELRTGLDDGTRMDHAVLIPCS
jgi:hypothetical protein